MQGITEIAATTVPSSNGDAPLPKRQGARGMLPSTWLGRSLRIGYLAVDGAPVETSGTLLDWCGVGPIFNIEGGRTVLGWDRVVTLELIHD